MRRVLAFPMGGSAQGRDSTPAVIQSRRWNIWRWLREGKQPLNLTLIGLYLARQNRFRPSRVQLAPTQRTQRGDCAACADTRFPCRSCFGVEREDAACADTTSRGMRDPAVAETTLEGLIPPTDMDPAVAEITLPEGGDPAVAEITIGVLGIPISSIMCISLSLSSENRS